MNKLKGVKENISLAKYTTFKIGGVARYFFEAKTKKDLIGAVKWAKENNLPFFVFGGGSNILVADNGFKGLAIKNQISKIKYQKHKSKIKNIYIGAGTKLEDVIKFAAQNYLTGIEWAAGIPGTVGGAIYGNAQAFGKKMSDIVEKVETFDCQKMKIKSFSNRHCQFKTKNSIFKENKNLIILSAIFKLYKGDKKYIEEKIKEFLAYRKGRHPNFFSAGSVFVNCEKKIKNKKILKKFPELESFNKKGIIPSAYLIEKCGLKGKKIGRAQISKKHANFIVNLGGAKAKDVLALIKLAKKKVKDKFGVELEEEIQIIN